MFNNGKHADVGGPYNFTSAWMSAGAKTEWVYVDMGYACSFDRVVLLDQPASGRIDSSIGRCGELEDIISAPGTFNPVDDITLDRPEKGRYVRVLMN